MSNLVLSSIFKFQEQLQMFGFLTSFFQVRGNIWLPDEDKVLQIVYDLEKFSLSAFVSILMLCSL